MLLLDDGDGDGDRDLWVKLEYFNPGGSVKDRTALALIEFGEREGLLGPGSVIVEPTSGNTGVGLAMLAAGRNYSCVFTVLDKASPEKVDLLRAYGAEVIMCPSHVPPDHPRSYHSVARKVAREREGSFLPNQYENRANQAVHYETTGPELWEQSGGRITHFVASAGTGGTISGAGRYLKERNPAIEVVCADPVGSIFSGPEAHPYLLEGVGGDVVPANLDSEVIDAYERVSDAEAFEMCDSLVARHGLVTGGSGGMVMVGAARTIERADPGSTVVALIPDSGRGYISKLHSKAWRLRHGFRATDRPGGIGEALGFEWGAAKGVTAVPESATLAEAVDALMRVDLEELPVASSSHPRYASELSGSISLERCVSAYRRRGESGVGIVHLIGDPLPVIGFSQTFDEALESAGSARSTVLLDEGQILAVMSVAELRRQSVLAWTSQPVIG